MAKIRLFSFFKIRRRALAGGLMRQEDNDSGVVFHRPPVAGKQSQLPAGCS
jgi:hypothetical protein